jgi:transcriptional regulator with XRE-family HTH domain
VPRTGGELVLPQFAVNLRAARVVAGHTQESLARALDVSTSTVQGWESKSDPRLPHGRNLQALADALEQEPGWFYAVHADAEAAA